MITIPSRPVDTSREADELQFKIVREMPPEKCWRILFDFIESGMRTLDNGIRYRHPGYRIFERTLAFLKKNFMPTRKWLWML